MTPDEFRDYVTYATTPYINTDNGVVLKSARAMEFNHNRIVIIRHERGWVCYQPGEMPSLPRPTLHLALVSLFTRCGCMDGEQLDWDKFIS